MPRPPLDVCWITQPSPAPFLEDLQTIQQLALKAPLKCGLAIVGESGRQPEDLIEAPNLETLVLQHSEASSVVPLALSDDDISAFASLLERLQVALGPEDEGELLVELAHLLMHLGPGFRPGTLLRHPSVIQQLMELHSQRGLGHTVTDTILIVNELLEIFQRTTNMVSQVPEAKLYHAVRGTYVGLIAALAAERHQSKLVYSDSLDPGDDIAPFWLNALPHHWHSSLAHSSLYRQLGERILMLTREILFRRSIHFITPFPNQVDEQASHVRVLGPGLAPEKTNRTRLNEEASFVIGWLMPTLTLSTLETLDRVMAQVADLSAGWNLRLIEAAPHRRDWVCDLETWLDDHPTVNLSFEAATTYDPAELDKIDILVALPGSGPTSQDAEPGTEEASWVVLEAISAGLPILGTRALQEWFLEGAAPGIFVEEGSDAKATASALRRLAEGSVERAGFAQVATEISETQFSRDSAVETLLSIYLDTLTDTDRIRPTGFSQRSGTSNWGMTKP